MLELRKIDDREIHKIINVILDDNLLSKTFDTENNMRTRLFDSCYACYIYLDNIKIGFINVIERYNTYEVDMGILSMYRGKGYATKSLNLLKENVLCSCDNVIIQTEKNNIAANKSILHNDFKLIRTDKKYNYYRM